MKIWLLYEDSCDESYEIKRLKEYFTSHNIIVEVYEPSDFEIILNSEKHSMYVKGEKKQLPNLFWPRLGASTSYFAFSIIREFERLGITVINSSDSISLVKDKLHTQQILSKNGLPTPKTILMKHPVDIDLVEKEIGFPCVIKCISGSQGKAVFSSQNRKEFETQIEILGTVNEKHNIIIQEFIQDSFGKDIRVFVLGGRPIAAMLRQSTNGDFRANISKGGVGSKIELDDDICWLAIEATKLLGLDIAGVDLLFDKDGYKICEVNSNPGFEGLEKYTGIDIPKCVYDWIKIKNRNNV